MGNRPGVSIAIPLCSLEFQIRQSQGDSTPGQASSSNLAPLRPEKRLIFWGGVVVAPFIGIKQWIVFPVAGMLCLLSVLTTKKTTDPSHAVDRFASQSFFSAELGSCFHHQDANPCFRKRLGSNTSGRT